jgi:hypothetical protein
MEKKKKERQMIGGGAPSGLTPGAITRLSAFHPNQQLRVLTFC